MYLLGYDLGSSSVKAALVHADSGRTIQVVQSLKVEMDIIAKQSGWAEQDPELWWKHICAATKQLLELTAIDPNAIKSIGIAYQMHGLVIVDKDLKVLRPSIIWCDSRAVEIGNAAFQTLGEEKCLSHLLNSPGNFTASKLKWVKEQEPAIYHRIHKIMLPGDYLAMKLTGEVKSTISGLSEGILWDFKKNEVANFLMEHYQISKDLIPDLVDTFSLQGHLNKNAARDTGLIPGIPITYRAGDQPNNALSLGVFHPNEVAATGGTSGVVYGIVDRPVYDPESRINVFAHVNHSLQKPRFGQLLCINGAGILYGWLKKQMAEPGITYTELEKLAQSISVGAEGLRILPFGNGAERILSNNNPGAQINNLQFNRHTRAHFYRAALEGIAFSFVHGFQILKGLGLDPTVIKVGNDNLFQSKIFTTTISNLLNCNIEVIKTTGAAGAAKAGGFGAGIYNSLDEAIRSNEIEKVYTPNSMDNFLAAYKDWQKDLERIINQ